MPFLHSPETVPSIRIIAASSCVVARVKPEPTCEGPRNDCDLGCWISASTACFSMLRHAGRADDNPAHRPRLGSVFPEGWLCVRRIEHAAVRAGAFVWLPASGSTLNAGSRGRTNANVTTPVQLISDMAHAHSCGAMCLHPPAAQTGCTIRLLRRPEKCVTGPERPAQ